MLQYSFTLGRFCFIFGPNYVGYLALLPGLIHLLNLVFSFLKIKRLKPLGIDLHITGVLLENKL